MSFKNTISSEVNRKVFTYILGGGLAYLFKLLFTVLFVEIFRWGEAWSYSVAILLTVIATFWYNAKFTFKVNEKLKLRMLIYVITLSIAYGIDVVLMISLTLFGLDYKISLTISTVVMSVLKYVAFNRIVFRS